MFNNFISENYAVCEIMWKNPDRQQMKIWRMRILCWIPKVTNTHSEYVILIVFHCKNGCTNAPQCYVTGTLPVLFLSVSSHQCSTLIFHLSSTDTKQA